jgi:threonine/homoserine/homoserine lactone efflux protein
MVSVLAVVVEHSSDEGSKTAFYVAAGLWACWAVLIGVIGVTRPAFPRGEGAARVVMLVSGVLMVVAMSTAVITAS